VLDNKDMDYRSELKSFTRTKDFFIGFDSDGCVFDSMELKHKECFCPAVINAFNCQPISKVAREVWDFVNLYSKTRGCNRFHAIQYFRDLLRARPEVAAAGFKVPELKDLDAWIAEETKLGNAALEIKVKASGNPELKRALDWGIDVNRRVEEMVRNMTPIAGVVDALERAKGCADLIVVSQTPLDAIKREWMENDILDYISLVAGQEHGTKTEHIKYATEGKGYDADKVLMVGDAPGDYIAAKSNNALFFPIVPGQEADSWSELLNNGLRKFFKGEYAGKYQKQLLEQFDAALPENPPW
jgi:phosphoglycolate phosphatase-like HAD superfamily hydrolase